MVKMYHDLFNEFTFDRHLGYFPPFAITNNNTMNIFYIYHFTYFQVYPKDKFL